MDYVYWMVKLICVILYYLSQKSYPPQQKNVEKSSCLPWDFVEQFYQSEYIPQTTLCKIKLILMIFLSDPVLAYLILLIAHWCSYIM